MTHSESVSSLVTHVYLRDIGVGANDSLAKIVARIRPGSDVLDIGTGSGALGRYLQGVDGGVVDGVTYNEEEAELARPHYRSVVVMDLEHAQLGSRFQDARYDVVVCADVLEHLRNAEAVLKSLAGLLKPGGVVIVSVPNVTHLGVVLGLLAGRFVRTHEGLLDATHVHFFDRAGFQALVDGAGFNVVAQDAVERNLVDTEFASLNFQAVPKVVGDYVCALPDATTYQFVWTLQPKDSSLAGFAESMASGGVVAIPVIAQVPYFRAQLFQDIGSGFSQEMCIDAFGEQADRLQTLQFSVCEQADVQAIRIDFADRPGQIEFICIHALDVDGHIVWHWDGDWAANLVYHQTDWTGARGWLGGRIVRMTGTDPWVQLPVDPTIWQSVRLVKLVMSGPLPWGSSDYPGLDARQIHTELNDLTEYVTQRVSALESQLDSARHLADFRQAQVDTLRAESSDSIAALEAQLADSSAVLTAVYQSRSWKLTKVLRWFSSKFYRSNQS
jgi:SAM-dependent methyltransferase